MKIAVIEDDPAFSALLVKWINAIQNNLDVHQYFTRDEAEAALAKETFDLVILDLELKPERNAGISIINLINKGTENAVVLVVSGLDASVYRGVIKALDAWDFLQKATFSQDEFAETFIEIKRSIERSKRQNKKDSIDQDLILDPLSRNGTTWRGKRLSLSLTAIRILSEIYKADGELVTFEDLFKVVKSGQTNDNIRKYISGIREAFKDIDPELNPIDSVPMRGFRWNMARKR